MWVIPKCPQFQDAKVIVDNETVAAVCAANLLVRSNELAIVKWQKMLSTPSYAVSLLGRVLVPTEKLTPSNHTGLLGVMCNIQATTTPQSFCTMQDTLWRGFITQLRITYRTQQPSQSTPQATRFLATPNTMDYLPPRSAEALHKHLTQGARAGRTDSGNLREQVKSYPKPLSNTSQQMPSTELNPRWVETLMGLPLGWTRINTKQM